MLAFAWERTIATNGQSIHIGGNVNPNSKGPPLSENARRSCSLQENWRSPGNPRLPHCHMFLKIILRRKDYSRVVYGQTAERQSDRRFARQSESTTTRGTAPLHRVPFHTLSLEQEDAVPKGEFLGISDPVST